MSQVLVLLTFVALGAFAPPSPDCLMSEGEEASPLLQLEAVADRHVSEEASPQIQQVLLAKDADVAGSSAEQPSADPGLLLMEKLERVLDAEHEHLEKHGRGNEANAKLIEELTKGLELVEIQDRFAFDSYDSSPSPLQTWTSQYEEEAVEPELAIFDPHHHLIHLLEHGGRLKMPLWATRIVFLFPSTFVNKVLAVAMPSAAKTFGSRAPYVWRYTGPDLLADIKGNGKGHNIIGTIAVEMAWEESADDAAFTQAGELDMFTETHESHPLLVQGAVPAADLRLGTAVEPVLKHYAQNPLVKGIRHQLAFDATGELFHSHNCGSGTAKDPKFREGFALLSKYKLSFDAWVYSSQLDGIVDLAIAFPETTIILNHIGNPVHAQASLTQWKEHMKRLATLPNVFVKVGGLGMASFGFGFDRKPTPPTSDDLALAWAPLVLFTIETFGVDRCMMESNFPMDKVSTSYTVLFNALKKIVHSYSEDDKRQLFEHTAKRVYRI